MMEGIMDEMSREELMEYAVMLRRLASDQDEAMSHAIGACMALTRALDNLQATYEYKWEATSMIRRIDKYEESMVGKYWKQMREKQMPLEPVEEENNGTKADIS